MFLFILESIGTPELILIAVIALIVLGPRKLPQMAKTIAKTMSEFRNATNEFKSTWEKEVALEDEIIPGVRTPHTREEVFESENVIEGDPSKTEIETPYPAPQITELTASEVEQNFQNSQIEETQLKEREIETTSNKRDWL